MRISSLVVQNFRGIRSAALQDLKTMVIVAGQNGSGKSCLLDAIRLIKSVYGGYQANEWHQWMGEFQINFQNRDELNSLMNDPKQPLRIICDFALGVAEREYITQNADDLVRQTVWRNMFPELYSWSSFRSIVLAANLRERREEIERIVAEQVPLLKRELIEDKIIGEFTLPIGAPPEVRPSKSLEIIFGTFRPKNIGVIDYHGPHRTYGRETLQGINLNLDALEQQRSVHSLYNYMNKYQNVKSEMAAAFIKDIFAQAAGVPADAREPLSKTLQELFRTFFPDKEFLGPVPTSSGTLLFPVKTGDGSTHDLNELSAGEKELLYGYLRLRNSAPRYSIILLDEPELHLNPRLIRGLPQFYYKHLGLALENQIWLVTHSDALLREAVDLEGCSIFHMQSATRSQDPQVSLLSAKEDLQKVIIDLVGDLAAYRPDAKIVIFEGKNSEFDQKMTAALFPQLAQKANLISAGSKQRVRGLHELLSAALERGEVPMKVYSIVDADADIEMRNPVPNQSFAWDAYHIENYLLEQSFVLKVIQDIGSNYVVTEEQTYDAMKECARETMHNLIRHSLASATQKELVATIRTSIDPNEPVIADKLFESVKSSLERMKQLCEHQLDLRYFKEQEGILKADYELALASDGWRKKFRGRDILKRLVGKINRVDYETFRNLIVSRMRDRNFQPVGMTQIVEKIVNS